MADGIEIRKGLVFVNSLASISTQLVSLVVIFWMHQFLLRHVSPEEYSIYPVILSLMSFTPIISGVMTGGIGRHVAAEFALGNERAVTRIVSSIVPLTSAVAVLYLLVGFLVAYGVGSILTVGEGQIGDAQIMVGLLVIVQSTQLFLSPFSVGLFVKQQFVTISVVYLVQEAIRMVLIVTLLLAVSAQVKWVIVAMVAAELFGLVATAVLSVRAIPALRFDRRERDPSQTRSLLSFGGWTVLGTIAYRIGTYADAIILNELAKPVDVAAQHLGALPMRRIEGLIVRVFEPLQPVLTAMHSTNRKDMLRRAYMRGNRYHLWVFMLPGAPLLCLGTPLADLYVGEQYRSGGQVLSLLTLAFIFTYSAGMLYRVVLATAQLRSFFSWAVATQVLNIVLTIYLVGGLGLGAVGSALGTLISGGAMHFLVFWPLGLRLVGASVREFIAEVIVPGLSPAAASMAAIYALGFFKQPESWASLGLLVLAGMIAYFLTLFLFALRPADRRDLAHLFEGIPNRLRFPRRR